MFSDVLLDGIQVLTLLGSAGVLVVQAMIAIMHLTCRMFARQGRCEARAAITYEPLAPFFSVHVATYDEPPGLMLDTLRHLADQVGWSAYEVIVLDNNTPDTATWAPLRRFCEVRPQTFRFHHFDNVAGAKAGALNLGLSLTDPRATHVVTVDADYRVSPDFLCRAATELRTLKADFIQFPQSYRIEEAAPGVALELADYFQRHARLANGDEAVLLTGTLSVISRDALFGVGGWHSVTATEDAELGVRLCRAGYRGRFVDRVVGKGLLPLCFFSLSKQRTRWAGGNLRLLLAHLPMRGMTLRRRVAIVSQLTAWLNFAAPAALGLAAGLAASALNLSMGPMIVQINALALLAAVAGATLPLALNGWRSHEPVSATVSASLTRLALVPVASLATVAAVLGVPQVFEVTEKRLGNAQTSLSPEGGLTFVMGLVLTGSALFRGHDVGALASSLLLFPLLAGWVTRTELSAYAKSLEAT